MAVPERYRLAFQRQLKDVIAFPIESADEMVDLPRKAKSRVLIDIYVQIFMEKQPDLRQQAPVLVRAAVQKFLRERGML